RPHDCPHRERYHPGLSPAQHVERRDHKQQQWHTVAPYIAGVLIVALISAVAPGLWRSLHSLEQAPNAEKRVVPGVPEVARDVVPPPTSKPSAEAPPNEGRRPAFGHVSSPDAGTGIWDGKWHHVAGTYDGAALRLYVDGHEV